MHGHMNIKLNRNLVNLTAENVIDFLAYLSNNGEVHC
jgi:hypothetical protein